MSRAPTRASTRATTRAPARARQALAWIALVGGAVALSAPGCAPRRDASERAGASGASGRTGAAGNESGVDTGRTGNTFVVTYDSGPVDRLRIVRDTAGRIVVEGACGFPDGTRVGIALMRPLAGGKYEPAAMTRARVELGRFQSPPLRADAGAPAGSDAAGRVRLFISASFTPDQQTDDVLHASANGRRFRGLGMRELPDGFAIYEQTVEAPL